MNDKEQIIEIAKLAGRVWTTRVVGINLFSTSLNYPPEEGFVTEIKTYGDTRLATEAEITSAVSNGFDRLYYYDYLNNRDDIMLVVNKIKKETSGRSIKNTYRSFLIKLFIICNPDTKFEWDSQYWTNCITATPRQICEALLKAVGKWKKSAKELAQEIPPMGSRRRLK
jgi:hypothetical protein